MLWLTSNLGLDSIIIGFYRGKEPVYASRVRAGFVRATRRKVFEQIKHLTSPKYPFTKLPEAASGHWGQGLTTEKMKECVWLKLETVAQIEPLAWTGADHLRHIKFVGLRDDKDLGNLIRKLRCA
ncbi:ATP dependent DNA ligase [Granulicella tundricola]|uniref:DNA ligase (ATP) n=1 Tax=Granulicella tundricola (strain ATCC BAA-1859 / DSM 23138 / MP5ACTX9) TaxID=1198114 RepID=E8X760_GRATM|nr:ATP-dependent DNA ligase [Granulicella tundricola]ADW71294.1 ATP dependent DNA ligase [Granulicella tundricola MP5ACTX9]